MNKTSAKECSQAKMQKRLTHTYLSGVCLGINAIKQAYLLVDAPNCCYKKVEYIDKNHDFFCDMFDPEGFHRIAHTDATTQKIIMDRTKEIEDFLVRISDYHKVQAIFLASMPSASLTGIQYDLIINKAQRQTEKPIIEIPAKNLRYDWLEGYADVLLGIARKIKLRKKVFKKNKVAVIGYFMDRNEGDHIGNIMELKRLCKKMDLDLISVWLGGVAFEELKKVEEAEIIISFPYARTTAREISKKTGAKVIETKLPFGLKNTINWIKQVSKETSRVKAGEKLIAGELKEVMPILEWVVPKFIAERSFSILADPYLAEVLKDSLEELGGEIKSLVMLGMPQNKVEIIPDQKTEIMIDPYINEMANSKFSTTDLAIGCSLGKEYFKGKPYLQFSFPAPANHCFYVQPFMGFKGFVAFVNRIVNLFNSDLIVKEK